MIICKECQHAVLPSQIDAQFAANPQHGLEKEEQQRIANEIAEIDRLISNEETLRQCEFPFLLATSKPIEGLAAPQKDGLQCKVCQYICCNKYSIQKHCWEEHRWKSKNKGG